MASLEPQQLRLSNKEPSKKEDGETKNGLISFSFNKKIKKSNIEKKNEQDFITAVEERELKSTKSVETIKKDLVIPLILKNRLYSKESVKQEDVQKTPSGQQQDSVESQAIKELIEESQKLQERWDNGTEVDQNLFIPMLMQNKLLNDFENGDHINVDLRPEESTEADYEQVPVKAYGLALLKGMGWKPEEGIGHTFKQDVKLKESQVRPKGLGLGADRTAIKDLEPTGHRRPPKAGEQRDKDDEELILRPGGCVLVQRGAHKDLYGKIECIDVDNARVVVKLAIGEQSVTISQYAIRLVPPKEYYKYSKDLSRLSKAHKEKERQTEEEKDRESEQRKRKHRQTDTDREKPPVVKISRSSPPSWLQRDLRVRFIDKTFKGGKYYNSKMRIEDVLAPQICVCRTDQGRLLDDVKQTMLETLVPRGDADAIMVVLGEHRGQVGHILKRDKEKCKAMVQLERYEEKLFTMDYDSICHYVGADH